MTEWGGQHTPVGSANAGMVRGSRDMAEEKRWPCQDMSMPGFRYGNSRSIVNISWFHSQKQKYWLLASGAIGSSAPYLRESHRYITMACSPSFPLYLKKILCWSWHSTGLGLRHCRIPVPHHPPRRIKSPNLPRQHSPHKLHKLLPLAGAPLELPQPQP